MKRILFFLFSVIVSVNIFADEITENGMTYTYDPSNVGEGATLKTSDKETVTSESLVIPGSISIGGNTYTVKTILASAFKENTNLKFLTIQEGVVEIQNYAFQGCTNLKMVELPSTLTTIGKAFHNCTNLLHVCCKASVPPTGIDIDTFFRNNNKTEDVGTLYVPTATDKETYKTTNYWKSFQRILVGTMDLVTYDGMKYVLATDDASSSYVATLMEGKNEKNLIIPSSIQSGGKNYMVKAIDMNAFSGMSSIAELTISEYVDIINNFAFYNCRGITNLEIPDNVSVINLSAFKGCSGLKKLKLPSGIKKIGTDAFYGCNNLTFVSCQKETPIEINGTAFPDKNGICLFVPTGSISEYRVADIWGENKRFKNIYGGDMIEAEDASANKYICASGTKEAILYAGKNSEEMIIPDQFGGYTVVAIGANAFNNCSSIKKLELPSTLTDIGNTAFKGCSGLAHVVCNMTVSIPDIKTDRTDVVFPSTTTILYIPSGTKNSYVEKGWGTPFNESRIWEGGMLKATDDAMVYYCATGSKFATLVTGKNKPDVVIPETIQTDGVTYEVKVIDKSAFLNCDNIIQLELPSSVTFIGNDAFKGCSKIAHILSRNYTPAELGSNVFSVKSTAKLYVPSDEAKTSYPTKSGWEFVAANILVADEIVLYSDGGINYVCTKSWRGKIAMILKSTPSSTNVEIPYSVRVNDDSYEVRAIDKSAFYGTGIVNLILPYGIQTIGEAAFQNCTKLTKVELPSTLTTSPAINLGSYAINGNAFYGCSNLNEIVCNVSAPNYIPLPETAFSNYAATLYVPAGTTDTYKTTDGWKKFTNIVEGNRKEETVDKLTYVFATEGTTAILTKSQTETAIVTIPATVRLGSKDYDVVAIDKDAFNGNTYLEELIVSETQAAEGNTPVVKGVKTIGASAFEGCTRLKKVTLPSTLVSLGSKAFYSNNNNIAEIVCNVENPGSISMGNDVFKDLVVDAATLYVPIGKKANYTSVVVWKDFKNILEGVKVVATVNELTYDCYTGTRTAILVSATPTTQDVTIPATITKDNVEYNVTTIGKSAFSNKTGIVNLTIKGETATVDGQTVTKGVQTIGEYAFQKCTNLVRVELPLTLTSVGQYAFDQCNKISNIICKAQSPAVLSENDKVFSSTTATLYVPKGSRNSYKSAEVWKNFSPVYEGDRQESTQGELLFAYATGDQTAVLISTSMTTTANVEIPESFAVAGVNYKVIDIAPSVFENKTSIATLTLPSTLTSIGAGAFKGCKNLTTITIQAQNPPAMNDDVFTVWSTAALYVPVGTKSKYQAAAGWSNFGNNIFEGKKVEVTKDFLTYVYSTDEPNATLIKSATTDADVTIPVKVPGTDKYITVIDKSAFSGNSKLVNLTIAEEQVAEGGTTVMRGVQTIEANAFDNCSSLQKIVLPSTVTTIGDKAFDRCNKIVEVVSNLTNPQATGSDVFTTTVLDAATLYVPKETKSKYTGVAVWNGFKNILEGVKIVVTENELTYHCYTGTNTAILVSAVPSVQNVTIPATITKDNVVYQVTMIEKSAFSGKTGIVNLTIKGGQTIGEYAFQRCTNLVNVELPSTLTSIGQYAFDQCNKISNIICKAQTPTAISDNDKVFSSTTATLYVPKGCRDAYRNANVWQNFSPVYEGEMKMTTQGDMTFKYATEDKTAVLVSSITTAANVVIPQSFTVDDVAYDVIVIDKSVFQNNTNIVTLSLPLTLSSIGSNAFNGCKNLTTISISAPYPPVITEDVFSVYSTASLYVPASSKARYVEATGWSKFKDNTYEGSRQEVTKDGLTYVYSTGEWGATLVKSTNTDADLTVPDCVPGTTVYVTAIGNSVFSNNTSLKTVTLPAQLESIGAKAFQNCSNLKKVTSLSNRLSIGDYAFDKCNNIQYFITNADTPASISEGVFSSSSAYLYVPQNRKSVYQSANVWKRFAAVYEGSMLEETQNGMSYVCATAEKTAVLISSTVNEADVIIPDSFAVADIYYKVIVIESSVFKNRNTIVNLTLPATLRSIGASAFYGCKNIATVTCKMKEPFGISDDVFTAYTASLFVPEGTRSKYQSASGWKNFSSIQEGMQYEVTQNGLTFEYVTGDKTATLVKSTVAERDFTIPGTVKVGNVEYKVTTIGDNVFKDAKALVNLTLSENIKKIGLNAFRNCSNLEKLDLPSTLTSIDDYAFGNCTRLAHIICKMRTPFAISENVFSAESFSTAKVYVPTITSADYKVTPGWHKFGNILVGEMKEVIQNDMTYYCVKGGANVATLVKSSTALTEVTIPTFIEDEDITYNVTDIGGYAFSGIGTLEKVTLSEGLKTIGTSAFQNCYKLQNVTLPSSLSYIGDYAFDKCSRLAYVVSKIKTPFVVGDHVFTTASAKLNVPVGTTEQYRSVGGWGNFAIILEGEMTEVKAGDLTFVCVSGPKTATLVKSESKASDLTIPAIVSVSGVEYAVTTIDESVFTNIGSLVNLVIPEGVISVGANAFKGCSSLNKVELPSTLTAIGASAFENCGHLTHISCQVKTPLSIPENVFSSSTFSNAALYVPVQSGTLYRNAAVWSNFRRILEGNIQEATAGGMTYVCVPNLQTATLVKGPSNVSDVVIPASINAGNVNYKVTAVDGRAFFTNNALVNLTVSEGIEIIGEEAFKNCSNLKSVELPSTLVSIGTNAFQGCSRLAEVYNLRNAPIALGDNVFYPSSVTLFVPSGAVDKYAGASGWNQFKSIQEMVSIKVSNAKQVAYVSDRDLNFGARTDLKVYVATGYDKITGTIWLTRVYDVPARTGFLLMGEAGTYHIPVVSGGSASYYKNMFRYSLDGMTLMPTDGDHSNYYLSNGDYGVGFYKVSKADGVKLAANRAYLSVPTDIPATGASGGAEAIKISNAGQVPYFSSQSLDFTSMEAQGMKAYTATGYDYQTGTIWLSRVNQVPAQTGVLIRAPQGVYNVPTASVASVYENMFKGSLAATTISQKETIAGVDYINYYLSAGSSGVGFYKVTDAAGVKLSANRCYLPIPNRTSNAGTRGEDEWTAEENLQYLSFSDADEIIAIPLFRGVEGDEDGTAGISRSRQWTGEKDVYYNLQGQRVDNPGKGLYIRNGRKVVIR